MNWLRDFFSLSRSQTNGLALLLPLLLLIIFSEPLYRRYFGSGSTPPGLIVAESPVPDTPAHTRIVTDSANAAAVVSLNPNTARYDDWLALNVPPRIAARIIAYRNRGGSFTYQEDLLKIYGLDSTLYRQVAAFIALPPRPVVTGKTDKKLPEWIDLNKADSVRLLPVRGIGPVLAGRIVRYRTALGGFVNWEQLHQVYGLDSAVIGTIKARFYIDPAFIPRKLNLNTATAKELAAHPLISNEMARAIVTYRHQHGNFLSAEDIRKIVTITEEQYQRIKPYLSVE
ncbi:MAG: hypothetical protein KatS3mg032_1224 [Cyclobacteriaceae bacterium]|nr:MAG: hypothetical protein KatS3mg032_1224 [Cyclobacteriaceae bacterium]